MRPGRGSTLYLIVLDANGLADANTSDNRVSRKTFGAGAGGAVGARRGVPGPRHCAFISRTLATLNIAEGSREEAVLREAGRQGALKLAAIRIMTAAQIGSQGPTRSG
jgi:hypothetical protein